jgi:hypothetical protein
MFHETARNSKGPVIAIACAVLAWAGCSSSHHLTNPRQAEQHALALANAKAKEVYGKEPFAPGQFPIILSQERWQWGRFDPAGVDGYSAQVSFRKDKTDPKVEVYFSTDKSDLIRRPSDAQPPAPTVPPEGQPRREGDPLPALPEVVPPEP